MRVRKTSIVEKNAVRFCGNGLPKKPIPAGYFLVHNHVNPTSKLGVKGFRAHKLLDSKGYAKLGGSQRNGTVAVDRYISYRRGNDIVTLGVWLPKDQAADAHEFHVSAPAAMIEGGQAFSEVRPGISEKDAQETRHMLAFKELPGAAAAFDAALAKITA